MANVGRRLGHTQQPDIRTGIGRSFGHSLGESVDVAGRGVVDDGDIARG